MKKRISQILQDNLFLVLTIIVTMMVSLAGYYIASVVGITLLCALTMPASLGILTRIVSAYALFFITNIVVVFLISLASLEYNLTALFLLYVVAIGLFLLRQKQDIRKERFVLVTSDALILGLGIIFFLLIVAPFRTSSAEQLVILSNGEDNASHYALTNSIAANKSLTYFIPAEKSGVLPALQHYPQGLHANLAINSQIMAGKYDLTQAFLLKSYVFQISGFFSLLFIIILLCIRLLALTIVNEKTFIWTITATAPLLLYAVGFGTNFYAFTLGFHSQIVAYTFILLAIPWLALSTLSVKARILVGAIIGLAVAHIWFFMVPVFAVFMLLWMWLHRQDLKTSWHDGKFIIPILVTGALIAVPFFIERHSTGGTSINTAGGIHPLGYTILLAYAFLAILYILAHRFKQLLDRGVASLLLLLLIVSLGFSGVIGMYQLMTIHDLAYYFYKSVYLVPVICAMLSYGFIFLVLRLIAKEKLYKQTAAILVTVSIFTACLYATFIYQPTATIHNYQSKQFTSRLDTKLTSHAMSQVDTITMPWRRYDIVLLNGCVPVEAYTTQRWLSALMLTDNSTEKSTLYRELLTNLPSPDTIKRYSRKIDRLDIIHHDNCAALPADPALQTQGAKIIPYNSL